MTIYLVDVEYAIEGKVACATLKLAREAARENAASGCSSTITRVRVDPCNRMELCAVYNRTGFAVDSVDIERWEPAEQGSYATGDWVPSTKPPKRIKLATHAP